MALFMITKVVTNYNCIHEKLGADSIRGDLAVILFRIFCLPVSSIRIYRLKYTKLQYYLLFSTGVKLGLSHQGKNTD